MQLKLMTDLQLLVLYFIIIYSKMISEHLIPIDHFLRDNIFNFNNAYI